MIIVTEAAVATTLPYLPQDLRVYMPLHWVLSMIETLERGIISSGFTIKLPLISYKLVAWIKL